VLSVILVRPLGLMGVAIGTLTPLLVSHVLLLPAYVLKTFEISLGDYIRHGIGRPLLTGTLMLLVAESLVWWREPSSWGLLLPEIALTVLAGLLLAFRIGMTRDERRDLLRRLSRAKPKPAC
jgi:hypothetical protein